MNGRTADGVGGHVQRSGFAHNAVPYSGRESFVAAAGDLLHRGLESNEDCLALAVGWKIDQLRSALGRSARQVNFVDLSAQGRNPARILPALRAFADAHHGSRICIVSEPIHTELSAAALSEALFSELVLTRPEVVTGNGHLSCLHDTASLESDALGAVETAHPDASEGDHASALLRTLLAAELPAAPTDARSCNADMTTLAELRSFVRRGAKASGLDSERSDDLVYAVNELVTNSICHGAGRATVLLWAELDATYCEVRDKGRIDDVLVGRVAPHPKQSSGRGLWLVNQLCDLVQVRSSRTGTVVRVVVDR